MTRFQRQGFSASSYLTMMNLVLPGDEEELET